MSVSFNLVNEVNQKCPRIGLDASDRMVVINCIQNYANPNCLSWLAFRIWNCIKAIFGQSDWQVTKNLIENRMFDRCIAESLNDERVVEDKKEQLMNLIREDIQLLASETSSLMLDYLLVRQTDHSNMGAVFAEKFAIIMKESDEKITSAMRSIGIDLRRPPISREDVENMEIAPEELGEIESSDDEMPKLVDDPAW